MASGIYILHFAASSFHRATFTGVSCPSFFRVQQLNSFFVIHHNYLYSSNQTNVDNPCGLRSRKKVLAIVCQAYRLQEHCVAFCVYVYSPNNLFLKLIHSIGKGGNCHLNLSDFIKFYMVSSFAWKHKAPNNLT